MSGTDGLRAAMREANERRLAELRAVSPRLAETAERSLRAVEERARRDGAVLRPEARPVRLNIGLTCSPSTAAAIEGYMREQPGVDLVVRSYPVGADGRPAAPARPGRA